MNKVEIVADSKNEWGQRITSIVATFPRMLLAEVNTHRAFSRNSASSRAIRFQQMVKQCQENPFIPFRFQKDHPGMQGTEYFEHPDEIELCEAAWLQGRDHAIQSASLLNSMGITKQLANRILEPFMYHTALITATEWENFINLRVSPFAEDHFQDLSEKILTALNESEPNQLSAREWHIPFGDKFKYEELEAHIKLTTNVSEGSQQFEDIIGYGVERLKTKLSTVRCARISYLTQGKETSIEEDLKLHDRLESSGHFSAFEHCAQAMTKDEFEMHICGNAGNYNPKTFSSIITNDMKGWCGNFRGFIQYRKMLTNENRTDSRLLKK